MHRLSRLSCLVLLVLVGCAGQVPAPAPEGGRSGLPNEVFWVRDSAEYRAIFLEVYSTATRRLGELTEGREPGTWAVALDADETAISNSQYEKELYQSGGEFSRESWNAWVRRQEATALPGVRAFLEHVHELGGKIAIVTNRDDEVCPDTGENFRRQELPFDVMLCKTDDSRKEARWRSVEDGSAASGLPPLEILMYFGDNIQDFPDWSQDQRDDPESAFADFSRRFFVLPNPMYGSWTGNPPN